MSPLPEQEARRDIDAALEAAGWIIQDRDEMNLAAGPAGGVAVREFRMASGHGRIGVSAYAHSGLNCTHYGYDGHGSVLPATSRISPRHR